MSDEIDDAETVASWENVAWALDRIVVPGGWIYRSTVFDDERETQVALQFVAALPPEPPDSPTSAWTRKRLRDGDRTISVWARDDGWEIKRDPQGQYLARDPDGVALDERWEHLIRAQQFVDIHHPIHP